MISTLTPSRKLLSKAMPRASDMRTGVTTADVGPPSASNRVSLAAPAPSACCSPLGGTLQYVSELPIRMARCPDVQPVAAQASVTSGAFTIGGRATFNRTSSSKLSCTRESRSLQMRYCSLEISLLTVP